MDSQKLKKWACLLEKELLAASTQSKDVAEFAKSEALLSAIKRAKNEEITEPSQLQGLQYWMFETEIPKFRKLESAIWSFNLLLQGWELPSETTDDN